jgi:serine/threonine protein kinase
MTSTYFPTFYGNTFHPQLGFTIVMEFCPLGDLRAYVSKNHDTISWKERRNILHEISIAISVAHSNNLVHCDLHSGNILRASPGSMASVKVSDFGLSRFLNQKSTIKGVHGILAYMAPELVRNKHYSRDSDIYALGMIMWELSHGRPPFSECNDNAYLAMRIINGHRPEIVEGTPRCWVQLMQRCWSADPNQRPSADDICDEVQTWSDCSNKPWNPNADTIGNIFSGRFTTNFDAVEELKLADNQNLRISRNASTYQMHSSRLVPLVTEFPDSRQEDCIITFSKGTN